MPQLMYQFVQTYALRALSGLGIVNLAILDLKSPLCGGARVDGPLSMTMFT